MLSRGLFEALYHQDESKAWKFYDLAIVEQAVLETADTMHNPNKS